MPLGNNVSQNIKELYKDNMKKGKAKGANGKPRKRNQIIAIAMNAAGKGREMPMKPKSMKKMHVAIHRGQKHG